jgi:hypothetical protein
MERFSFSKVRKDGVNVHSDKSLHYTASAVMQLSKQAFKCVQNRKPKKLKALIAAHPDINVDLYKQTTGPLTTNALHLSMLSDPKGECTSLLINAGADLVRNIVHVFHAVHGSFVSA